MDAPEKLPPPWERALSTLVVHGRGGRRIKITGKDGSVVREVDSSTVLVALAEAEKINTVVRPGELPIEIKKRRAAGLPDLCATCSKPLGMGSNAILRRSPDPGVWACRSCALRKVYAAMTPEQRSERTKKINASMTPEQRSERSRKGVASMTPEQRSERSRKAIAALTPEQRSEAGRKSIAALTPEQRSERGRKAIAALTPEQRSERGRKAQAQFTPEQRSERVRKMNAARKARRAP